MTVKMLGIRSQELVKMCRIPGNVCKTRRIQQLSSATRFQDWSYSWELGVYSWEYRRIPGNIGPFQSHSQKPSQDWSYSWELGLYSWEYRCIPGNTGPVHSRSQKRSQDIDAHPGNVVLVVQLPPFSLVGQRRQDDRERGCPTRIPSHCSRAEGC